MEKTKIFISYSNDDKKKISVLSKFIDKSELNHLDSQYPPTNGCPDIQKAIKLGYKYGKEEDTLFCK